MPQGISRPNAYSRRWHELFSSDDDPERTAAEVAFLDRVLPPGRVLDACCGFGRHAGRLAALGRHVTAFDRDAAVIGEARARHPRVDFRVLDVRELDLTGFDAAICLWTSFGWYDDAGNADVLRRLAAAAPRVVLDLYNRAFFEPRQGRWEARPGIAESKRIVGDRLVSRSTSATSSNGVCTSRTRSRLSSRDCGSSSPARASTRRRRRRPTTPGCSWC